MNPSKLWLIYFLFGWFHIQTDVRVALSAARSYLQSIFPTEGVDAVVFDIDETCLSNLPYYRVHQYGYSSILLFYVHLLLYNLKTWVDALQALTASCVLRFVWIVQITSSNTYLPSLEQPILPTTISFLRPFICSLSFLNRKFVCLSPSLHVLRSLKFLLACAMFSLETTLYKLHQFVSAVIAWNCRTPAFI